jgi:Periplasmic binding protein
MRSKLPVLAGVAALALVATAACTANDDGTSASGSDTTASPDSGNTADAGPAPGVTDDTVRVGVTYVDLDAVRQFVDLDQGDYEAAYRAVIDDVNGGGGIHGRTIEPVFAPVSPIGTVPAEEACVRLTEDEDVFAVIGFFQDDAVLCPLETHATAVIGGVATDARAERAAAPWFTTDPGSEAGEADAIRAMAEAGELDGRVGVFGSILSETQTNDVVLPLLEDLGIEPVIAERFRSQDVDTVLAVGSAAVPLANGLAPLDYRPRLRFTSIVSINAYVTGVNPDLSLLEGAVVGSADTEQYDEEAMQECIGVLEDAGISGITDPATVETGEPIPFVSASSACRNVSLLAAILEAAGPDLDYGTFQQAGESLTVHLPGSDVDYEFGPYPDIDGNLPVHLFHWDAAEAEFTRRDDG